MSDERDRDAFNNAQCPEFFAGWQCIREPGHSGEHRSRAVGPGMIDARPVSVPEHCIYVSAERAILQDLITELRDTAGAYPGATGRLLRDIAGSAEARLREVDGE